MEERVAVPQDLEFLYDACSAFRQTYPGIPFVKAGTVEVLIERISQSEAQVASLTKENAGLRAKVDQLVNAAVEERAELRLRIEQLSKPVTDEENFHFETPDVMKILSGTSYLRANVERHLSMMRSGERWSLYRAIAKLIAASRTSAPSKEPEK